jgi:ATP-dependent RNA helicase RhlE
MAVERLLQYNGEKTAGLGLLARNRIGLPPEPQMKFDKFPLSPEILSNLQEMGFHRTTDIQFKTIPAILKGEDVLAIAQTGTGKTGAFAIPIINMLQEIKAKSRVHAIRCLVMVPTRELAKQIGSVVARLTRGTGVTSYAIYGGVEEDPQVQQLAGGVDILIATPGRMFALIRLGAVHVNRVEMLVLDEADRMLDLGFIPDIKSIKRLLTQRHQTLFFSATINSEIKSLAYSQVRQSALRIQVSPENMVSKNITHSVARVEMDDKRHLLVYFLKANPKAKAIVFVRTQVRAERVIAHLAKQDIESVGLHGGLSQEVRETNLENFRALESGVLIATDVSARGIDVPGINYVVNYDVPDDPENYVHRVGRTGRGFAKGDAVTFCAPEELEKLAAVEELTTKKIPEIEVHAGALVEQKPTEEMSVEDMLAAEEARFFGDSKKSKDKRR